MEKNKKIKVAIISNGGIGGGVDNKGLSFLTDLVDLLAEEFDLHVFSFDPNTNLQPEHFTLKSISGRQNQPVIFQLLKMIRILYTAQKEHNFHIFHAFWPFPSGFVTVLLGKIFSIKTVMSLQGGGLVNIPEIKYGGNRSWYKRQINRWTLNNVTRITTLTKFLEQFIPTESLRKKNTVIYYGINQTKFKYVEKKIVSPVRFVHVANINAVKDQTTLIKCFEIISKKIDCRLKIVGPDYYGGKIHQLVKDLNLENKVEFLGFVNHSEVPKMLSGEDIMLHTSLHEGMGVVIAEAMALGILVCGTNVGLIADLSNECCIAVPVKDFEKLANEVLELLQDEVRMNKMRKSSLDWIKRNGNAVCLAKYTSIYKELVMV